MSVSKPTTVNEYMASFPKETKALLLQMKSIILKACPQAEEKIGYAMPAYRYNGVLVYFAGYKNHIGFYPSGSGIVEFQYKLSEYKFSKGAIQFPLDKPLPIKLITEIVKFRAKQNEEKETLKKQKASIFRLRPVTISTNKVKKK